MEEIENDIVFINGGIKHYDIIFNDVTKEYELSIIVEKHNKRKYFNPFQYLMSVKGCYYDEIDLLDKNKQLNERITKVYDAKSTVLRLIEEFQNEFDRFSNTPKKIYDYSNVLNEINSIIGKIRLELENEKYILEVEKLKFEKKLFIRLMPFILSVLAIVVSLLSVYISYTAKQNTPQKMQIEILKVK